MPSISVRTHTISAYHDVRSHVFLALLAMPTGSLQLKRTFYYKAGQLSRKNPLIALQASSTFILPITVNSFSDVTSAGAMGLPNSIEMRDRFLLKGRRSLPVNFRLK